MSFIKRFNCRCPFIFATHAGMCSVQLLHLCNILAKSCLPHEAKKLNETLGGKP